MLGGGNCRCLLIVDHFDHHITKHVSTNDHFVFNRTTPVRLRACPLEMQTIVFEFDDAFEHTSELFVQHPSCFQDRLYLGVFRGILLSDIQRDPPQFTAGTTARLASAGLSDTYVLPATNRSAISGWFVFFILTPWNACSGVGYRRPFIDIGTAAKFERYLRHVGKPNPRSSTSFDFE
jgi:hypothetical protein